MGISRIGQSLFRGNGTFDFVFSQVIDFCTHVQNRLQTSRIQFVKLINKTDHPLQVLADILFLFIIKMKPAQVSEVGDKFIIDHHLAKIAELPFIGHE